MAARAHATNVALVAILLLLCLPVRAAEPAAQAPPPSITTSRLWPYALDLHVMLGAEPHAQGTPIAFGVGGELLWHAWVGGFIALLSSEGSPILPGASNGAPQPSLADRVSIPLGLAVRPLVAFGPPSASWFGRLEAGIGVQLGATIEYLRTSDDSVTTAGLHAALTIDVPIWGGPVGGGVALRVAGRMIFTPSITLEANRTVAEPVATGQIFGGICFYP